MNAWGMEVCDVDCWARLTGEHLHGELRLTNLAARRADRRET